MNKYYKSILSFFLILILFNCSKTKNDLNTINENILKNLECYQRANKEKIVKNYNDGNTQEILGYSINEKEIYRKRFYENGKIYQIEFLKDNKPNGITASWYENGDTEFILTFSFGKANGEWNIWYDNGKIQQISIWNAGDLISGKYYNLDGILASEVINGNGQVLGWHNNGVKSHEATYVNGKAQGKWTSWYDNGNLNEITEYKNGKRHGKRTIWTTEGKIVKEIIYNENKIIKEDFLLK